MTELESLIYIAKDNIKEIVIELSDIVDNNFDLILKKVEEIEVRTQSRINELEERISKLEERIK